MFCVVDVCCFAKQWRWATEIEKITQQSPHKSYVCDLKIAIRIWFYCCCFQFYLVYIFFPFVVSCSIVCCFCNSLFLNRVRHSLYLMILLLLFFPCRRCRSSSSFIFLKWWIGLTVCVREFSSMCKSVWSPLICAFHRVKYTQPGKPFKIELFLARRCFGAARAVLCCVVTVTFAFVIIVDICKRHF